MDIFCRKRSGNHQATARIKASAQRACRPCTRPARTVPTRRRTVMRSIWKGAITFGLVNVPVKLYSATEDHDIKLHQVHDEDGGRIRYQRTCEIDGQVVPYEHIAKAYDDGDQGVMITDD